MTFTAVPIYRLLWRLLLVCTVAWPALAAHAADVSVRANISRSTTPMGEPVQYQIKVTGARRSLEPPDIRAEGLTIRFVGPVENSVTRFSNGSFSSERSVALIYQVVGEKNGSFSIPSVPIEVDGTFYRTEPIGLTVQPKSTTAQPGAEPPATGFAEFVLPKKTVYVGETIPVDLRLYVDARIRCELVSLPDIPAEGFTKQKFPNEPERDHVERNGREFNIVNFKTAITPTRAGKLVLGPSEIPFNARVPRARKGGPRSLLDMFDDDIFGDPMFSSIQQLRAKAAAVEILVKPLPAAGKPSDFSGAVGSFQFSADGTPKLVKVGDPVTMKLRVTGKGNFDRMSAPTLKDASGWRTYPPSNSFNPDDQISYSGTKTFEMAVVPETKKTAMPVFQFSYFDPIAEKYVTLVSEPASLGVEGNTPPVPPPVAPVTTGDTSAPPPPAPARANDILGLRYDPNSARDEPPLHTRREFWMAQGGVGLALLIFLGLKLRRRPDAAARLAADLRRQKAAAWTRLQTADLGYVDFFETAARIAQLETALATGRNAASIDAATVSASGSLSDESRATIDEIFSARAELLYAGGGRDEGRLTSRDRERVTGALRELEKSHAR